MANVTKSHAVFLGFCNDASARIRDDHSFEATQLRARIEALVQELESWKTARPKNKQATIVSVLEVHRRAHELELSRFARGSHSM